MINGKIKCNIFLIVLLLISIIFLPVKSYAALQANGASTASYTIDNWMLKVRQMEVIGGTLGKSETINTNSTDGNRLLATSTSNGLDCHMEKNSEYGALVLLSASAYGNPGKIETGDTTTGNCTGVVINLNNEIVSAGTVTASANYYNAHDRYKDIYYESYSPKKGDAIRETAGWHGGKTDWLYGVPRAYKDTLGGTVETSATLLRSNRKYIWLLWTL